MLLCCGAFPCGEFFCDDSIPGLELDGGCAMPYYQDDYPEEPLNYEYSEPQEYEKWDIPPDIGTEADDQVIT